MARVRVASLEGVLRTRGPRRAGLARLEPESSGQINERDAGIALRYGWGEVTHLANGPVLLPWLC